MEFVDFRRKQQPVGVDKAVCIGISVLELYRNVLSPSPFAALRQHQNPFGSFILAAFTDSSQYYAAFRQR